MTMLKEGARIQLKNILYLTDFSEPSTPSAKFQSHPHCTDARMIRVIRPVFRVSTAESFWNKDLDELTD